MRKRIERDCGLLGTLMCDVNQVAAACNLGVSTVWRLTKIDPTFPKPIYITPRVARWSHDDIVAWVKSRFEARNNEKVAA
mgnify:CR=1 FL=1